MKGSVIHSKLEGDAGQLLRQLEQHWHTDIRPQEVHRRIINLLLLIKRALARDGADARLVVTTYRRLLKHQAGKKEQAQANEALKRILGELSVVTVSILPFAFVTLPGLFALARHFNIELLPTDPDNSINDAPSTPEK